MDELYSKYGVVCVQVATPNAYSKADADKNLQHAFAMVRKAVKQNIFTGEPVKLAALPECVIHGFPYSTNKEYLDSGVYVHIPGPETEAFIALAKELDIIIVTGSMFEHDPKYPAQIFNTCCIVSPDGLLLKYRKVNPWVPDEGSTSPLQLKQYAEPLFPVVDTPLGKLGVVICYDLIFPETVRQLVYNGAEILIRVSAYMEPWVNNAPMDWWKATSQARSIENIVYGVHVNQGANLNQMPPFDFTGGSCLVDYEGRIMSEIKLGGDRIVYGHFDLDALREWRARTYEHLGIAHLRTEAYTYLDKPIYPCKTNGPDELITMDQTIYFSDVARRVMGYENYDRLQNLSSVPLKMFR